MAESQPVESTHSKSALKRLIYRIFESTHEWMMPADGHAAGDKEDLDEKEEATSSSATTTTSHRWIHHHRFLFGDSKVFWFPLCDTIGCLVLGAVMGLHSVDRCILKLCLILVELVALTALHLYAHPISTLAEHVVTVITNVLLSCGVTLVISALYDPDQEELFLDTFQVINVVLVAVVLVQQAFALCITALEVYRVVVLGLPSRRRRRAKPSSSSSLPTTSCSTSTDSKGRKRSNTLLRPNATTAQTDNEEEEMARVQSLSSVFVESPHAADDDSMSVVDPMLMQQQQDDDPLHRWLDAKNKRNNNSRMMGDDLGGGGGGFFLHDDDESRDDFFAADILRMNRGVGHEDETSILQSVFLRSEETTGKRK